MKRILDKMHTKQFKSLHIALFYTMLIGFAVAFLLFFLIDLGATAIIDNYYMSEDKRQQREETYVLELQKYITDNQLSSEDTTQIARWVRGNKYIYVMIYKDDQLIFDSGSAEEEEPDKDLPPTDEDTPPDSDTEGENPDTEGEEESFPGSGITIDLPTREDLIKYAEENDSHLIEVSDGHILASMADFTEYLYYDIVNIFSICVSVVAFIVIVMLYFNSVTGRITRLASDVTKVADGDMHHAIDADGRDEIARLSANVENMRSSILLNLEKERAALDANAELITSMSHDIRTPLTVLLGYLDMMKTRAKDETLQDYIKASEKTALRLKKLSDDMFNYFLVFGGENGKVEMDEYNLATLFEQMLSEHMLLLGEQGYNVNVEGYDVASLGSVRMLTDAPKLMRIIENVFSNIYKYADKTRPVSISLHLSEGGDRKEVKVLFTNYVDDNADKAESNHIGLKTCDKIAAMLGIKFSAERCEDRFEVHMSAPVLTEPGCAER